MRNLKRGKYIVIMVSICLFIPSSSLQFLWNCQMESDETFIDSLFHHYIIHLLFCFPIWTILGVSWCKPWTFICCPRMAIFWNSETSEWNLRKLSQNLYYTMPLCFFMFCFSIWVPYITYIFLGSGMLGITKWVLVTFMVWTPHSKSYKMIFNG